MTDDIDEPLWDLMCSTHSCHPDCGCDGDFYISADAVASWLDDFGEEFGRLALAQVDERVAGAGPADFWSKRGPTWWPQWRAAIEEGLRRFLAADTPTVEEAAVARAAADEHLSRARRWFRAAEQRALESARQDPAWQDADRAARRALLTSLKVQRSFDQGPAVQAIRAKASAEIDAAAKVTTPIEDACRANDSGCREAAEQVRAAEAAASEASRRLRRAMTAAAVAENAGRGHTT